MPSVRKFVRLITVAFLALSVYFSSFIVVRDFVIAPFEYRPPNIGQNHWIRTVYDPFYYPLRYLYAVHWGGWPQLQTLKGKLLRTMDDGVVLATPGGGELSARFVCAKKDCPELGSVKVGQDIEITLGATLVPGRDGFVNKFHQIRSIP
jgi:hypothetical protein